MSRNAFVDPRRRLIVFWSPKCGCTTAAKWFLHAVLARSQERETSGVKIGVWLDINGYACRHGDAYPLAAAPDYRTVLFTRNPRTRVASAFLNKFYVRAKTPIANRGALEPFAREFLDRHVPAAGLEDETYQGPSFREFILAIGAAKRRGEQLDHHWDTQFPGPVERPAAYPRIDHLVRLESFAADLDSVNTALGIAPWTAPVTNRTHYPAGFCETAASLGARRTVEMLAERIELRADNLYDADTLAALREIYAVDYERLPYAPPA